MVECLLIIIKGFEKRRQWTVSFGVWRGVLSLTSVRITDPRMGCEPDFSGFEAVSVITRSRMKNVEKNIILNI